MFDTGAIAIAEALVSVQRRAHLSHRLAIRGQVCAVLILVRVDAVVVKHVPHEETECPGQQSTQFGAEHKAVLAPPVRGPRG